MSLSAEKILQVSKATPEIIFDDDKKVRSKMAELSNQWHPDKNKDPKANEVFAHIIELYKATLEKIKNGTWTKDHNSLFLIFEGSKRKFRYQAKHSFGMGDLYIGNERVVYLFNLEWKDVVVNYNIVGNLIPPKDKESLAVRLPTEYHYIKSDDKSGVMIKKNPEQLCLYDVLKYHKGKLQFAHAAWMISELMNLSCFFEYLKIANNGISLLDCFINPAQHTLALYGGWWYSKPFNTRIEVLSGRTIDTVPEHVIKKDTKFYGAPKTDRYLIRKLACELFGDPSGTKFIHDKDFPKPIEQWLNTPPVKSAVKDYELWYKALEDSFGKRKFTEFKLTASDIYG